MRGIYVAQRGAEKCSLPGLLCVRAQRASVPRSTCCSRRLVARQQSQRACRGVLAMDIVGVLNLQARARRNALLAARRLHRERIQAAEAAAAMAAVQPDVLLVPERLHADGAR